MTELKFKSIKAIHLALFNPSYDELIALAGMEEQISLSATAVRGMIDGNTLNPKDDTIKGMRGALVRRAKTYKPDIIPDIEAFFDAKWGKPEGGVL